MASGNPVTTAMTRTHPMQTRSQTRAGSSAGAPVAISGAGEASTGVGQFLQAIPLPSYATATTSVQTSVTTMDAMSWRSRSVVTGGGILASATNQLKPGFGQRSVTGFSGDYGAILPGIMATGTEYLANTDVTGEESERDRAEGEAQR